MSTSREGREWRCQCDTCGDLGPVSRVGAREALEQAWALGWERLRPGLSDYCPPCLVKEKRRRLEHP